MCVVAAEFEHELIDARMRKNYRVGEVLKALQARNALVFPALARLSEHKKMGDQTAWQLAISQLHPADIKRLGKLHSQCGSAVHEFNLDHKWPSIEDHARQTLASTLNTVRGEHQWLWNRFWQQAITIRNSLVFIDLGDPNTATRPIVIKQDTLVDGELCIDFEPQFLADFSEPIAWSGKFKM
jgi:hypothetical protein